MCGFFVIWRPSWSSSSRGCLKSWLILSPKGLYKQLLNNNNVTTPKHNQKNNYIKQNKTKLANNTNAIIFCRTLDRCPDWNVFVGEPVQILPHESMHNFSQTFQHSSSQCIQEVCGPGPEGLAATFPSASLDRHDENNQVPQRKFSITRPNGSQRPTLIHLIPLIPQGLRYHIVMLPAHTLKTRDHSRRTHRDTKWISWDRKTISAYSHTGCKWGQVTNLLHNSIKCQVYPATVQRICEEIAHQQCACTVGRQGIVPGKAVVLEQGVVFVRKIMKNGRKIQSKHMTTSETDYGHHS